MCLGAELISIICLCRDTLGDETNLDSTCNSGCGCSTSVYDPVCANGIQYFTSCHAGCPGASVKNDKDEV